MMQPPHADFVEAEIAYRREVAARGTTRCNRANLSRALSWGRLQWMLGRHRPVLTVSRDIRLRAASHN
jgi:hypothetical protein